MLTVVWIAWIEGVEGPRQRTGLGWEDNTASYYDAVTCRWVAEDFGRQLTENKDHRFLNKTAA